MKSLCLGTMVLALAATGVRAGEAPAKHSGQAPYQVESAFDGAGQKFWRGAANVLTCWLEIPRQIHRQRREDVPLRGIPEGIVQGVAMTPVRLGAGVIDMVFFLVPFSSETRNGTVYYDYGPILKPEYAWQDW